MEKSVNPVFIKTKDIPESDSNRPAVLELCLAAERVSGQGSVVGAQCIRGLWRIYPATKEARQELLIQGMVIRNTTIQVSNTNPFILKNETGEEKPTTKVWIDNIPISVADSEIEHSLAKVGCELRSNIKAERARDADRKLTRFLTGRRFVFITVPQKPLEKFLKVSFFTATIFHREQKLQTQSVTCSKCLELGHHASACEKEVVCRVCRKSGHKRGDPQCQSFVRRGDSSTRHADNDRKDSETTDRREESDRATEAARPEKGDERQRGRVRQATLRPTLQLDHPRRHRSETPKRRRSAEETISPGQGKQPRRDDTPVGRQKFVEQTTDDAGQWG